ncbi:hypothetical protein [Novosphingobium sp. RL4]|uniref:hypothetical protein n=1 Tax=Novosphingobium sp. RL4 TaxID=3109595 RepID=UPI002D781DF1|nr:hypothetical protein [Novosphingobium sp. RL4]WRT91873.1 hypothetical protein U9J33_11690 [Novosphingobium sp. RL4]
MPNTRTEHTPGPWELIHFGGPQIGHKASGEAVCTMWGDENDPADPFHANAALIAAAPELLTIAERLLDRGYVSKHIDEEHDDHMQLVAAIAKARGAA